MKKRIWLLGSGPSLKQVDLNLLIGEDTLACNKINKIFPLTSWRPTYYYMVDFDSIAGIGWQERAREILPYVKHAWLWDAFKNGHPEQHPNHDILPSGIGEQPNVTWIPRCRKHHIYGADNPKMKAWGWHLPELCTAVNSASAMMQIATLLGYEEIYLLGFDLGFTPDRTQNHFVEDYSLDTRDKSVMDNHACRMAHEVSRRDCPAKIYNATPGGFLDVHPRVDMKDILNAEKEMASYQ